MIGQDTQRFQNSSFAEVFGQKVTFSSSIQGMPSSLVIDRKFVYSTRTFSFILFHFIFFFFLEIRITQKAYIGLGSQTILCLQTQLMVHSIDAIRE